MFLLVAKRIVSYTRYATPLFLSFALMKFIPVKTEKKIERIEWKTEAVAPS